VTNLLTLAETAARLRKSEAQMRWMRHRKIGPKSALLGGRVMFREEDIDAWVEEQFAREAS
jgi:predicted DNA-binding transcriptional regulator AlpA